jgi:hypothetical protein
VFFGRKRHPPATLILFMGFRLVACATSFIASPNPPIHNCATLRKQSHINADKVALFIGNQIRFSLPHTANGEKLTGCVCAICTWRLICTSVICFAAFARKLWWNFPLCVSRFMACCAAHHYAASGALKRIDMNANESFPYQSVTNAEGIPQFCAVGTIIKLWSPQQVNHTGFTNLKFCCCCLCAFNSEIILCLMVFFVAQKLHVGANVFVYIWHFIQAKLQKWPNLTTYFIVF